MNLCKDCKHFAQEGNATNCRATAISLIDGEARHSVDHCAKARGRNGRCGLEGRLYEPAELIEVTAVLVDPSGKAPDVPVKVRKPRAKKPEESTDAQAE